MLDMTDNDQPITINYGFFKRLSVYEEMWKWLAEHRAQIEFVTVSVPDGITQERVQISLYKNAELIYVNSLIGESECLSIIFVWRRIKEKYEAA